MLNSVLSEDVVIMPCKGILRACAMSLPVSVFVSNGLNLEPSM